MILVHYVVGQATNNGVDQQRRRPTTAVNFKDADALHDVKIHQHSL